MNKVVFTVLFLVSFALFASSQSFLNSVNVEVRYPLTVGNNFMNNKDLGTGYQGIIDAGLGLNAFRYRNFSLGFQYNTTVLRLPVTDLTATAHIPRITVSYDFTPGNIGFIPGIAFGYSAWRFKSEQFLKHENGVTFEGSVKIAFRRPGKLNFYISGGWQFTRLDKPKYGEINSGFNRNISMIYPGIGMVWKLK